MNDSYTFCEVKLLILSWNRELHSQQTWSICQEDKWKTKKKTNGNKQSWLEDGERGNLPPPMWPIFSIVNFATNLPVNGLNIERIGIIFYPSTTCHRVTRSCWIKCQIEMHILHAVVSVVNNNSNQIDGCIGKSTNSGYTYWCVIRYPRRSCCE